MLYSTFIGGEDRDWGYDIFVNSLGWIYIGGYTTSTDFPTTPHAYDKKNENNDIIIVVFNFTNENSNQLNKNFDWDLKNFCFSYWWIIIICIIISIGIIIYFRLSRQKNINKLSKLKEERVEKDFNISKK